MERFWRDLKQVLGVRPSNTASRTASAPTSPCASLRSCWSGSPRTPASRPATTPGRASIVNSTGCSSAKSPGPAARVIQRSEITPAQREILRALNLLAVYPAAPVVAVVCDNVIIHHSKIVGRWLAAHPRVVVLHRARYGPHDNPVERIWGALKAWLANSPTLTIQGRVRQVHAFFRQRSPAQVLATAAPHSSPWLPEGYVQNFSQARYATVELGSRAAASRF